MLYGTTDLFKNYFILKNLAASISNSASETAVILINNLIFNQSGF